MTSSARCPLRLYENRASAEGCRLELLRFAVKLHLNGLRFRYLALLFRFHSAFVVYLLHIFGIVISAPIHSL